MRIPCEGTEHHEQKGKTVFHDAKIGIPKLNGVTVFSVCLIIFSSTIQVDANQKSKLLKYSFFSSRTKSMARLM